MGALVGWSALTGAIHTPAVYLYAGAVLWTIGYDTIYAMQDREDDALIGIGSTARLFAGNERLALILLYSGAVLLFGQSLYLTLGIVPGRWPAYLGLAIVAAMLGRQIVLLDPADPARSLSLFKSDQWVGWAMLVGLLADAYFSGRPPSNGGFGIAFVY